MGIYGDLMSVNKGIKQAKAPSTKKSKPENKKSSKNCHIAINITISQSDIDDLRLPTYSAQTLRLRESDVELLRDTSYFLRKNTKQKIAQSDVVRLALCIFNKLATSKNMELSEVISQIKD